MSDTFVFPPYFGNADHTKLSQNQSGYDMDIRNGKVVRVPLVTYGHPRRRNKLWKPLFARIDAMYGTTSSKLPIGTKLYHGSIQRNFKEKSPVTYFGLDAPISIWAIAEAYQKSGSTQRCGYLHEFVLTAPMNYKYVASDLGVPLQLDASCAKVPCVHPQTILHSDDWTLMQELGTELTVPHVPDGVKRVCTYEVDVQALLINRVHDMLHWDPTHAIKRKMAPSNICERG